MKVILIKDIEKLGKKYEIKEISLGYARNYLIPKKLVVQCTNKLLKWAETKKKEQEEKAEKKLKKITNSVSEIDGLEVEISVKIGKEKQFFEKINQQKISDALKGLGYEIKKTQIELEEPLQEIGEFPVKLKFQDNLEADIKVIITEEK
ncbi:50S ribosomal protein L9 [Candidatus Atribacteria bacterium MT.SAG.1]|nr:50S ribosomal protein L9 [Candidatus Atribacteria bacterium MT.SAG.1]